MSIVSLLGEKLRRPNGDMINTADALQGIEVLGLFFSAHWCPPCKSVLPVLCDRYTKMKEAGKKIEIIFVCTNDVEAHFEEFHSNMSFPALPYELAYDRELFDRFELPGIPFLVLLHARDGFVKFNKGGVSLLTADNFLQMYPFL